MARVVRNAHLYSNKNSNHQQPRVTKTSHTLSTKGGRRSNP